MQAEFPEKAGSPGTWPLVPQSRAFSGLQEVTSTPLHREPVYVCVSLCPQTGASDLAVTVPVEVLITTLTQARLTVCRPVIPSPIGGLTLNPREALMGRGPGQPPGLNRLGVCTACPFSPCALLFSPFSSSFGRCQSMGEAWLPPTCSWDRAGGPQPTTQAPRA